MNKFEKIQQLLSCETATRASYAALATCHTVGCFLTGKPELYGPIAALYFLRVLAKHQ